jgi:hypothetical protein
VPPPPPHRELPGSGLVAPLRLGRVTPLLAGGLISVFWARPPRWTGRARALSTCTDIPVRATNQLCPSSLHLHLPPPNPKPWEPPRNYVPAIAAEPDVVSQLTHRHKRPSTQAKAPKNPSNPSNPPSPAWLALHFSTLPQSKVGDGDGSETLKRSRKSDGSAALISSTPAVPAPALRLQTLTCVAWPGLLSDRYLLINA